MHKRVFIVKLIKLKILLTKLLFPSNYEHNICSPRGIWFKDSEKKKNQTTMTFRN